MRFTDAHSSSGICSPSRYALLTGRHHWRDFSWHCQRFRALRVQARQLTLPEMLRSKGYTTAAIGKWHLGWDWDAIRQPDAKPKVEGKAKVWGPEAFDWSKPIPGGPLAHGFDSYFGDDVINFPPYCWIENNRVVHAPDTMMDTEKWKAIKEGNWECRPGPMISGWIPIKFFRHLPVVASTIYVHAKIWTNLSSFILPFHRRMRPSSPMTHSMENLARGPFGDFVHETDQCVGQLLQALQDAGIFENTIVIFLRRQRPEKYAYARDEKLGHWSAYPLRGLKRDIYEGGHRLPSSSSGRA